MGAAAKKYLTPEELAERWEHRITVGTLANWRAKKRNQGPSFTKLGGRVVYPIEGVEAYEAAKTTTPANDN